MADLDALILSFVRPQWLKVARVVGDVWIARGQPEDHAILEIAAARIVALVRAGRLDSQGDLSRPRHSEVRLPSGSPSL